MARCSAAVEKKIKAFRAKLRKLDQDKEYYEDEIERLEVGECPIKPGFTVTWKSGSTMRRGVVISVSTDWRDGYKYRCNILNKAGTVVGFANINDAHQPEIVKRGRR